MHGLVGEQLPAMCLQLMFQPRMALGSASEGLLSHGSEPLVPVLIAVCPHLSQGRCWGCLKAGVSAGCSQQTQRSAGMHQVHWPLAEQNVSEGSLLILPFSNLGEKLLS